MENLGDIDVQSIAGAISTATHGTGARLRNISSQVAELTLVLATARRSRAPRSDEPELFRAARVGLGALGVIAEVTLRCVPAFTLRGVDAPAPLAETLARFEELALANDHFEFFVFPHADIALTRTNNRTEEPAAPARPGERLRQRRAAHQPRLRAVLPPRAALARAGSPHQPAGHAPRRRQPRASIAPIGSSPARGWCASPRWSTRCRASARARGGVRAR